MGSNGLLGSRAPPQPQAPECPLAVARGCAPATLLSDGAGEDRDAAAAGDQVGKAEPAHLCVRSGGFLPHTGAVWTELQMPGSYSGQKYLPGCRKSQVQTNNYKPGGREGLATGVLK